MIHALDENAREYYNLEDLWTTKPSEKDPMQVIIDVSETNEFFRSFPFSFSVVIAT